MYLPVRIKKILYYSLFLVVLLENSSCKSFRRIPRNSPSKANILTDKITQIALTYKGVPYQTGGNSYKGIDCSGLLCCVFKEIGVKLPRISWQQAQFFPAIEEPNIKKGDLVFFITNGGKYINHAGIVTEVRSRKDITFINASSSRGVVEENLFSNYWHSKLAKITRPTSNSFP